MNSVWLALRVAAVHVLVRCIEERDFAAQPIEINQVRLETVVEVGGVVGDLVHEINELSFERRALLQQVFGELGEIPPRNNRANV